MRHCTSTSKFHNLIKAPHTLLRDNIRHDLLIIRCSGLSPSNWRVSTLSSRQTAVGIVGVQRHLLGLFRRRPRGRGGVGGGGVSHGVGLGLGLSLGLVLGLGLRMSLGLGLGLALRLVHGHRWNLWGEGQVFIAGRGLPRNPRILPPWSDEKKSWILYSRARLNGPRM